MRPPLRDVAEQAGVSQATVSRVVNGRPGVADATRRAVLAVLAEHGFTSSPIRTRSNVVGIVTPELENPIFPLLAQTIEARLARHGLLGMICPSTPETAAEQDYLDHFATIGAAGVVVVAGRYAGINGSYAPYEAMRERGMPIVLVNAVDKSTPVPAVGIDLGVVGEVGVDHLVSLGHRRLGCLVGPRRFETTKQLLAGYRRAVDRAALGESRDRIAESTFTMEGGEAGAASLLDDGATGIVTTSDIMAIGAIAEVRSRGLQVPDDVSVVGLDGTPSASLTDPPLTTSRQPVARMASAVVALLTSDAAAVRPTVQLFRPELVVGGSTGVAPAAA